MTQNLFGVPLMQYFRRTLAVLFMLGLAACGSKGGGGGGSPGPAPGTLNIGATRAQRDHPYDMRLDPRLLVEGERLDADGVLRDEIM